MTSLRKMKHTKEKEAWKNPVCNGVSTAGVRPSRPLRTSFMKKNVKRKMPPEKYHGRSDREANKAGTRKKGMTYRIFFLVAFNFFFFFFFFFFSPKREEKKKKRRMNSQS